MFNLFRKRRRGAPPPSPKVRLDQLPRRLLDDLNLTGQIRAELFSPEFIRNRKLPYPPSF